MERLANPAAVTIVMSPASKNTSLSLDYRGAEKDRVILVAGHRAIESILQGFRYGSIG